MITLMTKCVEYQTMTPYIIPGSRSHLEVKGKKLVIHTELNVPVISLHFMVVFSYYLIEIFTLISRCVDNKTHDSVSKVKVTLRDQWSIFGNLYFIWTNTQKS